MPVGFYYFIHYGAPSDVPLLTIDNYYSTVLKLMLLFGLAFELPVIVCLLGFLGLVDAALLRKQRRVAIIIITIAAALFAPPDAVSMLMLGGPLYLLYEGFHLGRAVDGRAPVRAVCGRGAGSGRGRAKRSAREVETLSALALHAVASPHSLCYLRNSQVNLAHFA